MAQIPYEGPERRNSKRLKKQFSVRLQIQPGAFTDWDIVLVNDISRQGLSFLYDKPLKKGTLLTLKINFNLQRGVMQCVGQVVRVRDSGVGKVQDIGVTFMNLSEADSELINQAAVEFQAAKNPKA